MLIHIIMRFYNFLVKKYDNNLYKVFRTKRKPNKPVRRVGKVNRGKKILCITLTLIMTLMLLPAIPASATHTVTLINEDSTTNVPLDDTKFELWQVGMPDSELTGFVKDSTYASEFTYTGSGTDALITAEGGQLQISGLPAGNYYLKETVAPGGYTLPTGAGAKNYFTLGIPTFTATARRDATGIVSVDNDPPGIPAPNITYGPRLTLLGSSVFKFLKKNGSNSGLNNYVSSFARTADDPNTPEDDRIFYYNNCIENSEDDHAFDNLVDDLMPQVRWIYSHSPAADGPIKNLSQIVDWYDANIPGLTDADFNLQSFKDYFPTEDNKLTAVTALNKMSEVADYRNVLADVGLVDFDQFIKLVVTQMAFSGAIWHFTDGLEVEDTPFNSSGYGWGTAISIPPAVKKIYNWYMDNYAAEQAAADVFNNTPNSFSLVRTDSGLNPLQHTFALTASPANSNWSSFEITLSGSNVSFSNSTSVTTKMFSAADNVITVYLDAAGADYSLTGSAFLLDFWYGRETDSPDPSNMIPGHDQDHAIVLHGKKALVSGSFDVEIFITNAITPVTPYLPPPTTTDPDPDPEPEPKPEPKPDPKPEPKPDPEPEPPIVPTDDEPNVPVPTNPGSTLVPDDYGCYIEIDENGVPQGKWHYDEEEDVWIFEAFPPLGNVPQTGNGAASTYLLLMGVALIGISGVMLLNKKPSANKA